MDNKDAILWDGVRNGDKNSFDSLYYGYVNLLYNYSRKITQNDVLVEDCIQELFADLWLKRKKLGKTDNVKAYLLISIKRRVIRKLSQRKKELNVEQTPEFEFEVSIEDKLIIDDSNHEQLAGLNASIQQLTPRQREIVYLKFYENLSYDQIAKVLEVETKAVYKLMARALSKLKEVMLYLIFFTFHANRFEY